MRLPAIIGGLTISRIYLIGICAPIPSFIKILVRGRARDAVVGARPRPGHAPTTPLLPYQQHAVIHWNRHQPIPSHSILTNKKKSALPISCLLLFEFAGCFDADSCCVAGQVGEWYVFYVDDDEGVLVCPCLGCFGHGFFFCCL